MRYLFLGVIAGLLLCVNATAAESPKTVGILVCNEGRAAQSVLLADGSQRLYSCPVGQCVLVKNRWFNREEGDQKFSFDANCVEPPGTHGSEGVDHIGHPIGDDRLQK
jgi:hypothetical protein